MSFRHPVLRSAATDSLYVPRTELMFGERAFRVTTPRMRNQLPNDGSYFSCGQWYHGGSEAFIEMNYNAAATAYV